MVTFACFILSVCCAKREQFDSMSSWVSCKSYIFSHRLLVIILCLESVPINFDYRDLLIVIWTNSSCFIIYRTVDIWIIIKGTITSLHGPSPSLVHKVPVKACEWPMLVTFVLEKGFTLLNSKFFKVPEVIN